MTENEKNFVKSIVEYKSNVANIQQHIKEAYNVDSQFDEEKGILYFTVPENINESSEKADFIGAKEYVDSAIDETLLQVKL